MSLFSWFPQYLLGHPLKFSMNLLVSLARGIQSCQYFQRQMLCFIVYIPPIHFYFIILALILMISFHLLFGSLFVLSFFLSFQVYQVNDLQYFKFFIIYSSYISITFFTFLQLLPIYLLLYSLLSFIFFLFLKREHKRKIK